MFTVGYNNLVTNGSFNIPAAPLTGAATGTSVPPGNISTYLDYTNIEQPSNLSSVTSGMMGSATEIISQLSVYNIGPDGFKILGMTLVVTPKDQTTSEKVKMIYGTRQETETGTTETYEGGSLEIEADKQITFTNLSTFVLQRLTILADNYLGQSLYIYLTPRFKGFRINNLSKDIIVIDLYNNT